jgi:hypothetical protein
LLIDVAAVCDRRSSARYFKKVVMSANSELFIDRLRSLSNVETDDNLVSRLYDLRYLIENDPDSSSVVPHIFAFFEAHPEADFGATCPFIHFLEKQPDHEKYLIASVERKPTYPAVQMINRILNSNISSNRRSELLALLKAVEANPENDQQARDHAEHFLEYQTKRRRP